MDFKSLLTKMTTLQESEAPNVTTHKGTYGNSYQPDEEGNEKAAPAPKRGRGRPKKNADSTGHVPQYKFPKNGPSWLTGGKFKAPKGKTTKHSLKDWVEMIDERLLAEASKNASPKQLNEYLLRHGSRASEILSLNLFQDFLGPEKASSVVPEFKSNRNWRAVEKKYTPIAQKLAALIKERGRQKLTQEQADRLEETWYDGSDAYEDPDLGAEALPDYYNEQIKAVKEFLRSGKKVKEDQSELITTPSKPTVDIRNKKGKVVATAKNPQAAEMFKKGDISLNTDDDELNEADIPTDANDLGAGLGAGRSSKSLEEAKRDKNMDKKLSKPTSDADEDQVDEGEDKIEKKDKKSKKRVVENAEHRQQAAHHAGKAHALAKQPYACSFDDPEEAHMYHEGYKEGLDDLYAQMPAVTDVEFDQPGAEIEADPFGSGGDMGMPVEPVEEPMHTPIGGLNHGAPKSFDAMAFESLDKQLNKLLAEGNVAEGLTVSISKGQEGSPDTVSVNATDEDSDQLLALVKQAGLGVFAGDEQAAQGSDYGAPRAGAPAVSASDEGDAVVSGNDSMLDLIRKVTDNEGGAESVVGMEVEPGSEATGSEEETDESSVPAQNDERPVPDDVQETSPSTDERPVPDDVQEASPSQDERPVPDDVQETSEKDERTVPDDIQEAGVEEGHRDTAFGADAEMRAGAAADDDKPNNASQPPVGDRNNPGKGDLDFTESEELDETANSAENTFEADLEYLTRMISGGLNKEKSTGQSTVPVVSSQTSRLGTPMHEEAADPLNAWRKLSGIR